MIHLDTRFFEIALYGFLNFFPYLLFALYPFKKRLRFSKKITIIAIVALTLWEIVFEYLSIFFTCKYPILLTLFNTLLFALIYFLLICDNKGKLLFTLLMISNYANFIVIASTCLSNVLFNQNSNIIGHYTTSLSMFIIQCIFLPFVGYHFKKYYAPTMNINKTIVWNYLWVIPLIFYTTWIYLIYFVSDSSYLMALKPSTSFFLFVTTLGAWLMYHIIIQLVQKHEEFIIQQEKAKVLEIQTIQYKTLSKQIEEARIARHDLRHHITLIDNFIVNKEFDRLHHYLATYKKSLLPDSQLLYCKNEPANLIISYYAQQSKIRNIDFRANVNLPSDLSIDNPTLSILLGNLLENAVDGCLASSSENKYIEIKMQTQGNILLLSIKNSASVSPDLKEKKQIYSTKHDGIGFGLSSIKTIVERFNGTMDITSDKNSFTLDLLLKLS